VTLHLSGLSKTYPSGVTALSDITLTVPPGMFGLLGPNGAGKSTLMRTIATLQPPDRGSIRFGDIDVLAEPARLRAQLGYLPQDFGLYPTLSAAVILDHFAALKGYTAAGERRDVVEALLQQVNLSAQRDQPVGGFSGGMKQRLGIAIALAGAPRLVIVDEPTAGLDPSERQRFLELLADIGPDVVVLLSTHIVEDVRALCSALAIIDQGRVVVTGAPQDLIAALTGRVWQRAVSASERTVVAARHRVISLKREAGVTVARIVADQDPGQGFVPVAPGLEDVYFHALHAPAAEER
jgi:ABC-2 type transport system ATP-binding protein